MDDSKNCVLVARREYTIMLNQQLYPGMYQGLKSIWDDAKRTAPPRRVYEEFQNRLTRVKKWNQDVIDNEYRRIVDKSRCDWLDELIKRVFVINTQILAAVNMHAVDPGKKIKVKVPKGDKFIHFCYKECARSFYENALLMEDRAGAVTRVEQIKNLQKAYKLITTCIENTIRNMLPIESLLRDNVDSDGEGEDATPNPMLFPSMRPPPLSETHMSRRGSVQAPPHFPTYDSAEPEEATQPAQKFDPETLFQPRGDKPDHDSESVREPDRDREREGDQELERQRDRDRESDRDRDRETRKERERSRDREDEQRAQDNLKTIYIGPAKQGRTRDHELRSEDSDEGGRAAYGEGGRSGAGNPEEMIADIATTEIPMLGLRTPHEQLDLDVNTERNELPIMASRKQDDTGTGSVETLKDAVPPLEHFDTANFFSDVE